MSPENQERMERRRQAVLALEAVAADPRETPARRARAREALASDYDSSGSAYLLPAGQHHTSGGGAFLATQAVEQGWESRR